MEKHRARLNELAQTKCCCYFDLKKGCIIIGIILTGIMAVCIISTIIRTVGLKQCEGCAYNSWKYAYGYSISASIYCCLMFLINLWFIWGVKKEKKSVVLAWVVISAVWLMQTSCLLFVLIVEYSQEVGAIAWIFALVFTIVVIVLLAYFLLVAYGYWLHLRGKGPQDHSGPEIN